MGLCPKTVTQALTPWIEEAERAQLYERDISTACTLLSEPSKSSTPRAHTELLTVCSISAASSRGMRCRKSS